MSERKLTFILFFKLVYDKVRFYFCYKDDSIQVFMPKKKTQEEVIAEFKAVHGNFYDYNLVIYKNNSTEIIVLCPIHGPFHLTPGHHKKGVGCRKCYDQRQKMTKNEFVIRSQKHFGDRYDYSLFNEILGIGEQVQIRCKVHDKTFYQNPHNHVRGHVGCSKCKSAKLSGTRHLRGTMKTQEELTSEFIDRARSIHGDRFDYSKFVYVTADTTGIIICHKHAEFPQSPNNHLRGSICPDCSLKENKSDTFKQKCKELGINYWRAIKRREAGHSDEKIFEEGYIRNSRATTVVSVYGIEYPNLEEAIRALNPSSSAKTLARRIKDGLSPEEAFERIPNPGYRNGIIYLISHIESGKKYVGLTVQTLERRWKYHIEQAKGRYIQSKESLHTAILKFGETEFNISIIDRGITKTDLEAKERKWIKDLGTLVPIGYNISSGGVSGGSNPKQTIIDGEKFISVHEAALYLEETRNISYHAAKWRIRKNKIDVKSPAKSGESLVKSPAYKSWSRIKHGVLNQNSKDYIPGIEMYIPWQQFDEFLKDNGQPPETGMAFTRLDKSKGFFPENCKWLTKSQASVINAAHMKEKGTLTGRKTL